jgi:hypothetical protein
MEHRGVILETIASTGGPPHDCRKPSSRQATPNPPQAVPLCPCNQARLTPHRSRRSRGIVSASVTCLLCIDVRTIGRGCRPDRGVGGQDPQTDSLLSSLEFALTATRFGMYRIEELHHIDRFAESAICQRPNSSRKHLRIAADGNDRNPPQRRDRSQTF